MPVLLLLCVSLVVSPAVAQDPGERRDTVLIRDSRSVPREIADDVARVFNAAATRRFTGTAVSIPAARSRRTSPSSRAS
jgi:hypothetical protein